MSLKSDYKAQVKMEHWHASLKGKGKPFWVRLQIYLKALVRIAKLSYLYQRKKRGETTTWENLEKFLKQVLSLLQR